VGAKPNTISVGIINKRALKNWLDYGTESMMYHSISIGGSRNHPAFWIEDFKGGVPTGPIGFCRQLGLEGYQLCFETVVELQDTCLHSLASLSFTGCQEKVFKLNDLGPEVAMAFDHY
jgi:hypothetical protein